VHLYRRIADSFAGNLLNVSYRRCREHMDSKSNGENLSRGAWRAFCYVTQRDELVNRVAHFFTNVCNKLTFIP